MDTVALTVAVFALTVAVGVLTVAIRQDRRDLTELRHHLHTRGTNERR